MLSGKKSYPKTLGEVVLVSLGRTHADPQRPGTVPSNTVTTEILPFSIDHCLWIKLIDWSYCRVRRLNSIPGVPPTYVQDKCSLYCLKLQGFYLSAVGKCLFK